MHYISNKACLCNRFRAMMLICLLDKGSSVSPLPSARPAQSDTITRPWGGTRRINAHSSLRSPIGDDMNSHVLSDCGPSMIQNAVEVRNGPSFSKLNLHMNGCSAPDRHHKMVSSRRPNFRGLGFRLPSSYCAAAEGLPPLPQISVNVGSFKRDH